MLYVCRWLKRKTVLTIDFECVFKERLNGFNQCDLTIDKKPFHLFIFFRIPLLELFLDKSIYSFTIWVPMKTWTYHFMYSSIARSHVSILNQLHLAYYNLPINYNHMEINIILRFFIKITYLSINITRKKLVKSTRFSLNLTKKRTGNPA